MTDYNPEALEEEAENVPNDDSLSAEITEISETTAGDVFGDDSEADSDKEMIEVMAETDGGTEIEEIFSLPQNEMSWRNPNFKLARYRSKYGKLPEVGDSVDVETDDNGFLAIALASVGDVVA